MKQRTWIAVCAALGCVLAPAAFAAGPVDGEIGAVYWNSEFDASGVATLTSDAGSPGVRASLWLFNRYGLKAQAYKQELDDFSGVESADYTSVDLMWRALSPTQNNYLAFGLGWQEMDLETIGLEGSTSGLRLNVEGRAGLGKIVFAYAEGAYQPSLDDADASLPAFGRFEDLRGYEAEAGVSIKPAPFVQLRVGYRLQNLEFDQTGLDPLLGFGSAFEGSVESSGFLAGLTFNF